MPFTLSHPAAILPLAARFPRLLSCSALAIGSMLPDLVYFLPQQPVTRHDSHTLSWLCQSGLPAGLLLYLLWHAVLRQPLLAMLPCALGRKLAACAARRQAARATLHWYWRIALLLPALLLGGLTHLLWDNFTHGNTFALRHLPWLAAAGPAGIAHYQWLQHASTLLGAGLLWLTVRQLPAGQSPVRGALPGRLRWLLLLTISLGGLLGACYGAQLSPSQYALPFYLVVSAMDGMGLILLAACLLWHGWQGRQTG